MEKNTGIAGFYWVLRASCENSLSAIRCQLKGIYGFNPVGI